MKFLPSLTRGSTFRARLVLDAGLKGWTFTSQARHGGVRRLLNEVTCREIDVGEACVVEIECPTDGWPLSVVLIDIRAEQGGEIVVGEIIQVSVSRGVTDGSA